METGELSPTLVAGSPANGLNFYRPRGRVVLFLFLAPVFYELWWFWQFFTFAHREDFPRARSFWWLLVPIYGWVVVYRQLDDLKDAERAANREQFSLNREQFSPGLAILLVISSWLAGNISARISAGSGFLIAFVVSGVLIAFAGGLVQSSANSYLKSKNPQAQPLGVTWGEAMAAGLGTLFFAAVAAGIFL